jgi:outer membrane protein assembly factor BamB
MKLASIAALTWLIARSASASPLEKLWQVDGRCEGAQVVDAGAELAWLHDGQLTRVDRVTGKRARSPKLKLSTTRGSRPALGWAGDAYLVGAVGGQLVVHGGHSFAVVDGSTGALSWQAEQPATDGGLPYLHVAAGDVFWVHPAHLGLTDPPVFVERLALASGVRVWRSDTVPHSGQVSWVDSDEHYLYVLTDPDTIGDKVVITAFDLAAGTRKWSIDVQPRPAGAVAVGSRGLAYGTADGLHVVDATTGKQALVVPLANASDVAIAGDRAYVTTDKRHVTAVDLTRHAAAWTTELGSVAVAMTRGAVYISDDEQLYALDPVTGGELGRFGFAGGPPSYGARDANAPAAIACVGGTTLLALGPSDREVKPEHAIVTGRLACTTCKHGVFPPTQVHLGSAIATTDAAGRFTLAVEARGALTLWFDLPSIEAPTSWAGDVKRVVRFGGSRRYSLGTLRVHQDCGPIEPPCSP